MFTKLIVMDLKVAFLSFSPEHSLHQCKFFYRKYLQFPSYGLFGASLVAQKVKNVLVMQETQVQSLGWEDTVVKEMAIHTVFLPGEFRKQRSL